jgi:hypothetical protein
MARELRSGGFDGTMLIVSRSGVDAEYRGPAARAASDPGELVTLLVRTHELSLRRHPLT